MGRNYISLDTLSFHYDEPQKSRSFDLSDFFLITGEKASGKSTFVRFIMHLLGNPQIQYTPTVEERVSLGILNISIGECSVEIILPTENQENEKKYNVTITDRFEPKEVNSIVLGINKSDVNPKSSHLLGGKERRSLSDLFQYLFQFEDLPSGIYFRHLLSFCYMKQEESDSDFFGFKRYKTNKQHTALKYILGYEFEAEEKIKKEESKFTDLLEDEQKKLKTMDESFESLKYPISNDSYERSYKKLTSDLNRYTLKANELKKEKPLKEDHPTERKYYKALEISREIRKITMEMSKTEESLLQQENNCSQCPKCRESLPKRDKNLCGLCGQPRSIGHNKNAKQQQDYSRLESNLKFLQEQKREIDSKIDRNFKNYTPRIFANQMEQMSKIHANDLKVKESQKRVENLEKFFKDNFPKNRAAVEKNIDNYKASCLLKKKEFKEAKERPKIELDKMKDKLLNLYTDCLKRSKVISSQDSITGQGFHGLTFIPFIKLNGKKIKIHYDNIGSCGNKVLYKACFLVALHRLAQQEDLRIPNILILDTPTKNIGEKIDKDVCVAFYQMLHNLKKTELKNVQLIVVDNQFPKITSLYDKFYHQYMNVSSLSATSGPLIPTV